MAGIGRNDWPQPRIAAGVALHHATDVLYHEHPLVRERMAREAARLQDSGIPRRRAQALAHVGLELVTDGILSADQSGVAAFRAAVARATGPQGPVEASLESATDRELWRRVAERLRSGDFPARYREADFVATRLEIVFRRRPRLAFEVELVPALASWVSRLAAEVGDEVQVVRDEVVRGLRREGAS